MSERDAGRALVVLDGQVVEEKGLPAEEWAIASEVARLADLRPEALVLAEMREDELIYGWCRRPRDERLYHSVFYNDFDDYEDDIRLGDERWLGSVIGWAGEKP